MSDGEHKEDQRGGRTPGGEVEAVIHAYLTKRYPALANLKADTPLLADGLIDSLGVLELMTFMGERFDFEIEDSDFDGGNLANLDSLVRFVVERKPI